VQGASVCPQSFPARWCEGGVRAGMGNGRSRMLTPGSPSRSTSGPTLSEWERPSVEYPANGALCGCLSPLSILLFIKSCTTGAPPAHHGANSTRASLTPLPAALHGVGATRGTPMSQASRGIREDPPAATPVKRGSSPTHFLVPTPEARAPQGCTHPRLYHDLCT